MVEDVDSDDARAQRTQMIDKVEKIYLTNERDVLPEWEKQEVANAAARGVQKKKVLR
ncbi:hypothetical protein [Salmonella enterica]|uniref:hypothetical protein n=1 Tax=Salmonella enterica TaxID=28901 RepID=UPI0013520913|nr:hypothetical protein [Salmonella enterica]